MNIQDALAFDTVQANFDVQDHSPDGGVCPSHFALKAHDAIAILQVEIKRLKLLSGNYSYATIAKFRYRDLTALGLPACIDYNVDTGRVVCMPATIGKHCDEPYSVRWVRLAENRFSLPRE